MSTEELAAHVVAFAEAPALTELPAVVDVATAVPANPPEQIQLKFVGLSYTAAYAEADRFVTAADEMSLTHGLGAFATLGRVVDFGSGWGRITRTLLTKVEPTKVYAVDVDPEMTALVNSTLPGVNAMTIDPVPPTVLGDASVDTVLAFSVFSHLSGPAHEMWAAEIGRITRPGASVVITVLDEAFFGQVAGAQAAVSAGGADAFATRLAATFDDLAVARAGFAAGEVQYAGIGGGEVRTGDYYGWAAAPPRYLQRVWGAAGFRAVRWVPSGILFPQAMVVLVRAGGAKGTRRAQLEFRYTTRVRPVLGRLARRLGKRLFRRS